MSPNTVPCIQKAIEEISGISSVHTVILFSHRVNLSGETTAFKLCLIADTGDKQSLSRTIYRQVDCDIPYNLVVYTPAEWQEAIGHESSFASKIKRTGRVVYG